MKTVEQKINERNSYIKNTLPHLFVINDNRFYKIIKITKDNVDYLYKLEFNSKAFNVSVVKTDFSILRAHFKEVLFPQYMEFKSIPYFKQMRALVRQIENEIMSSEKIDRDFNERMKVLVEGFEVKQ